MMHSAGFILGLLLVFMPLWAGSLQFLPDKSILLADRAHRRAPPAPETISESRAKKMSISAVGKHKHQEKKEKEKKVKKEANREKDAEKDIYQWFKTYSEVVGLVEKKAFRTVDFAKFIQNSLKAAAGEIDAHSAFLNKINYQTAMESTSGEFSGIGVSIISKSTEDEFLVVIDVVEGGPAEKAGMKRGDKIVEVNGFKLRGLSTDETINKLKGKVGTELKVKVIRNKKPMEFKVTRDIVKDQNSICFYFKDLSIYYLSLKLFTEDAATQMSKLLEKANEGKCKGIVLDMRRNPGGVFQAAIDMAGLFVDRNSLVVVTKDRNRQVVEKYHTTSDPVLKSDVPIIILIDNFTASAAEILAGCLKYHASQGRKNAKQGPLQVFLVGVPTFGKGSVQEVIPISNGCALKLTTMLYYLPGDLSIQATGIEPDFTIKPKIVPADEMKWITEMYGKETSLKRHITKEEAYGLPPKPKKGEKGEREEKNESAGRSVMDDLDSDEKKDDEEMEKHKKWEDRVRDELSHDIQVQTAVNMVNLLNLAHKCDPKIVSTRQKALEFLKQHYVTDDKVEIEQVK